jgi:peroxiredoxin
MRRRLKAVRGCVTSARTRKRASAGLAALGLAALIAAGCGPIAETTGVDQADWLGKAAPDFALTNLSGKTLRLSDFKGKVVLLDFWATWCPPCREEIPDLIRLQQQYASQGFTVLGIALDEEGATVVKPVAQRLGINYPVVVGNTQVAAAYGGIEAIPTTFIVGRDGKILTTYVGAQAASTFQQDIDPALRRTGNEPH